MTTSTRPTARSRTVAGRYLLIEEIAAGGMGSVWRARDLRTRKYVAAKVLGRHDSALLLRFVREQSLRIRHPHVVAPIGWAAEDETVVFTMDLVSGGTVQGLLDDHGPLPEAYVAVLLDQLLQALEAVHGAGVVHRDVKPANLLLEPTGTGTPHLRLGDFGVAATPDELRLTRVPGPLGTDGYIAPEQLGGARTDPRQDLYAAGVVAVQLLTGLGPRHQKGAPMGLLQPIVAGLIEPDPALRIPSAGAALARLRELGGSVPWNTGEGCPEVIDKMPALKEAGGLEAILSVACFLASGLLGATALALVLR